MTIAEISTFRNKRPGGLPEHCHSLAFGLPLAEQALSRNRRRFHRVLLLQVHREPLTLLESVAREIGVLGVSRSELDIHRTAKSAL